MNVVIGVFISFHVGFAFAALLVSFYLIPYSKFLIRARNEYQGGCFP